MRPLASSFAALLTLSALCTGAAQSLRIHPENPHYFEFRGQPLVIVSSAEHYGMVLNSALDYHRYLDALAADGMNYTRLFSGAYVEKHGAFGIQRNTLAPGPGKFLAPWARSTEPGYTGGGNKFDLTRWDPAYFARLKDFISEAGRRGIVVELTLFSSIYSDDQWSVNVFNPANNLNGPSPVDRRTLQTLDNGGALAFQERLVRKLVRELNPFDNLLFELQNEPWADHHSMGDFINPYLPDQHRWPNAVEIPTPEAVAWQAQVAAWIRDEEQSLPARHLIGQNVANFRLALRPSDYTPDADIIHFHYAYPEAAWWNYGLGKLIGYDESGFKGPSDAAYRREAWTFLLAGGGLFNSLDYSFTEGHEDGTDTSPNGPGGGSPRLRQQLKILSRFIHSFEFVRMKPDFSTVKQAYGVQAVGLSDPGKEHAFYLRGRAPAELLLSLPAGSYLAEWIDPLEGATLKTERFEPGRGTVRLISPPFEDEIALRIKAM